MIGILNAILRAIGSVVQGILNLLPDTPFNWTLGDLSTYWGIANYFIPFQTMATLLAVYVIAVATWYGIRWVLRLTKYIG